MGQRWRDGNKNNGTSILANWLLFLGIFNLVGNTSGMVSPCRKGWSTDPGTLGMDTSLTTSMKNGGCEGCQQNMWILIGKNKVFLTTNRGDIYIYTHIIYIHTHYIYMCVWVCPRMAYGQTCNFNGGKWWSTIGLPKGTNVWTSPWSDLIIEEV